MIRAPFSREEVIGYSVRIGPPRPAAKTSGVREASLTRFEDFDLVGGPDGAFVVRGPTAVLTALGGKSYSTDELPAEIDAWLDRDGINRAALLGQSEVIAREVLIRPGDRLSVNGVVSHEVDPTQGGYREAEHVTVFADDAIHRLELFNFTQDC